MTTLAAPLRIDDPRDNLEKARHGELVAFARSHKVAEVKHDMPAILIRRILRSKRLTNIQIPHRVLGLAPGVAISNDADAASVSMDDDLAAQYAHQPPPPARSATATPVAKMSIGELRTACKAAGITIARTDNMEALRAKLSG